MSQLKVNFLNWQPDADDYGNPGLIEAKNVIHDTEGYKPIYVRSGSAFSTTGALQSVTSVQARRLVSPNKQFVHAWLADDTLYLGLDGVTIPAATTGYPVSFSTTGTNQAIYAFDSVSFDNYVLFVASANQDISGGTQTITSIGYIDLDP